MIHRPFSFLLTPCVKNLADASCTYFVLEVEFTREERNKYQLRVTAYHLMSDHFRSSRKNICLTVLTPTTSAGTCSRMSHTPNILHNQFTITTPKTPPIFDESPVKRIVFRLEAEAAGPPSPWRLDLFFSRDVWRDQVELREKHDEDGTNRNERIERWHIGERQPTKIYKIWHQKRFFYKTCASGAFNTSRNQPYSNF